MGLFGAYARMRRPPRGLSVHVSLHCAGAAVLAVGLCPPGGLGGGATEAPAPIERVVPASHSAPLSSLPPDRLSAMLEAKIR